MLIFMKLLPQMRNLWYIRASLVFWLFKSIYGLKQSKQLKNQKVINFFKILKFTLLNTNLNIFILGKFKEKIIIISIYIDDFLLVSNSLKALTWSKNTFSNKYNIKDFKKVKIIIR